MNGMTIVQEIEEVDVWHEMTHAVGDSLGYGWIVGLALIGASWFFRKRIRRFFE